MPPRRVTIQTTCCPLCDERKPLPYRYDICTQCHEDITNAEDSEWDPDSTNGEEPPSDIDDDSDMGEAPVIPLDGVVDSVVPTTSPALEKH